MNLIDTFVESLENEEAKIDLKDIISKKEDMYIWEKFVDIFDCIELDDVLDSLKKVSAKYKLSHKEEITVLAYVKFLELMLIKANIVRKIEEGTEKKDTEEPEGAMYG